MKKLKKLEIFRGKLKNLPLKNYAQGDLAGIMERIDAGRKFDDRAPSDSLAAF